MPVVAQRIVVATNGSSSTLGERLFNTYSGSSLSLLKSYIPQQNLADC